MADSSAGDWEKVIGLADMHGTVARVSYIPADSDGDAMAGVVVQSGAAMINSHPTSTALRQWAAAMLDAADAIEAA